MKEVVNPQLLVESSTKQKILKINQENSAATRKRSKHLDPNNKKGSTLFQMYLLKFWLDSAKVKTNDHVENFFFRPTLQPSAPFTLSPQFQLTLGIPPPTNTATSPSLTKYPFLQQLTPKLSISKAPHYHALLFNGPSAQAPASHHIATIIVA